MARKKISADTEHSVLVKCLRRCAMCFALNQNTNVVAGQIAHIDRDNTNDSLQNLVYLCLPHHNDYDSTFSQTKRWTVNEVIHFRDQLHLYVTAITQNTVPPPHQTNSPPMLATTMAMPSVSAPTNPILLNVPTNGPPSSGGVKISENEINKVDIFLSKYAALFTYLFMSRQDLGHTMDTHFLEALDELCQSQIFERVRSEPIKTLQENLWQAAFGLREVYGEYQDYNVAQNRLRFDNKNSTQEVLRKNKQMAGQCVSIIEECHFALDDLVAREKNGR